MAILQFIIHNSYLAYLHSRQSGTRAHATGVAICCLEALHRPFLPLNDLLALNVLVFNALYSVLIYLKRYNAVVPAAYSAAKRSLNSKISAMVDSQEKYNKRRKRIKYILWGLIPVLLILASITNYLINIPTKEVFKAFIGDKLTDIIIGFISAIIFYLFTDDLIERARNIKEEHDTHLLYKEIDKIMLRYKDQLYYMDVASGLTLAKRFIDEIKNQVLVLGTAKSELLNTNTKSAITAYTEATEHALRTKQINYKRITKYDISNELKLHLMKCLSANTLSTKAEIMIMDEFVTANTFLIVDDKFLFISPTSSGSNLEISNQCHITTNKQIISIYRNHFNDIYEKGKGKNHIFKKEEDFQKDKIFDKLKNINALSNSIKDGISEFTSNAKDWQVRYSENFLNEISTRISLMSQESFEVKHKETFSDLHLLAASFINIINFGDSYETISFPLFWKDMNESTLSIFEFENISALERKASISRKLIVDKNKLNLTDYVEALKNALRINLKWNKHSNYHFEIVMIDCENADNNSSLLFSFAKIKIKKSATENDLWILAPDNENQPKNTKVFHANSDRADIEFKLKELSITEEIEKYNAVKIKSANEVYTLLKTYIPDTYSADDIKALIR